MTKLYANISIGHENDLELLQQRVVAAAQCNADAIVISKSTPHLVIPEEKRYVAIDTKWGTMPYIDAAKRSELTESNAESLVRFCADIGIPIIWSITDSEAGDFIKEHCSPEIVKLHNSAPDPDELVRYSRDRFEHVIYNIRDYELVSAQCGTRTNDKRQYSFYYTTDAFPPETTELNFNKLDWFIKNEFSIGYEGREAGIFPTIALGYKGVTFVEKYIGEPDSDNPSILTPAQFYDMFNSMYIMEQANQAE